MTYTYRMIAGLVLLIGLMSCSSESPKTDTATAPAAATKLVRVHCINEDFSENSNLQKYEKKFVVVPYKKLKMASKEKPEKDTDEPENLYFERVAKMAEKILTDAGLEKAKASDKNALIVGLTWSTKKRLLGWKESAAFTNHGQGQVELEKFQKGEVYLNGLSLKAVAPDKKTTRWELDAESAASDTFYLSVLPPLFAASAEYAGKNCDKIVEKSISTDSPEVTALKNVKN